MLDQCWATVYDAGPTLVQHLVGVSCLLGYADLKSEKNTFGLYSLNKKCQRFKG